jgi:predicted DNA-binding transcriptional regulator AlpA
MADKRSRGAPIRGSAVIWPSGIEERYGISSITRWRWERAGKLPPRDVHIGGRSGWKPATIETAESAGRAA